MRISKIFITFAPDFISNEKHMLTLLQTENIATPESLIVPDSVQKAHLAKVVEKITSTDYSELLTELTTQGCWILLKIVLAFLIYFVGKWITKWIIKLLDRALTKHNMDASLASFLRSLVRVVMMFMVIIVAVQTMGINTSSFIALFASAGLAVGMALSGTLQNFAGGVILLLLRPYRVGDYITAQGQSGTVTEIGMFSTKINTSDNRVIYIPNSSISTSIIDNYSQADTRRISWTVSISYGDDVNVAREQILKMLNDDARVLADPEAKVFVSELAASSVDLSVRAWVKSADYWDVYFTINELIYTELPKSGINFPYPKMDINITNK